MEASEVVRNHAREANSQKSLESDCQKWSQTKHHILPATRHTSSVYYIKVKSLSRVRLFATPWTVAYQAPPSMGFSRQEYWSGLPFPSPGDPPNSGIIPGSAAFQADALTFEPSGKPVYYINTPQNTCMFPNTQHLTLLLAEIMPQTISSLSLQGFLILKFLLKFYSSYLPSQPPLLQSSKVLDSVSPRHFWHYCQELSKILVSRLRCRRLYKSHPEQC